MEKVTFKKMACVSIILILTAFTFSYAECSQRQGNEYGHVKQQLHSYLQQLTEAGTFSGTVLIGKEGKILFMKGYGMADYEEGIPNTPETLFNIASMTKAFTTMAILMLEEKDLLSVKDTIDKFIPGFPHGNLITIHQLMIHTSGLFLYLNDPGSLLRQDGNLAKFHTPEELMEFFMYQPLKFEPGLQWEYCNSGYILLGIIIERLSGVTFNEFIKINILKPLNAKHISCDPYGIEFQNKRAIGYDNITTDPPTHPAPEFTWHPGNVYSAAGMFATVKDLYKWDQALYTNQLVSYETLEKMFAPSTGYRYNYAYAWFIDSLEHNGHMHKHIWHPGALPGYHSMFSRFVDDKLTIIILENISAPLLDLDNYELKIMSEKLALMILENN